MHVPRNILVATDLSDASLAAVDAAAGMVGALGAQVALVCAFDPMQSLPMVDTAMGATDIWTSELDELEDRIERALEKVRDERFAGTGCDVVVIRDGSPGRAIADEAERRGADLVIVGSHGRTGVQRFLLGSVAEKTVRLCKCSVLVVR
ncbi:MAG: universal stress protein UspA [Sandaracinus sp.]|nr:universal stress protein UspA [Sandaracinus sp.]|tara:strand:+ start:260 stop:706 length:447 start_codon:yes stop_codon:yes gene_type:complete